jgi:hypothetical protein
MRMRFISISSAVMLAVVATTSAADAKQYNVAFLGERALKEACKAGGGSSTSGANSYACTYKNGNIRECSRKTKKCIVETPPKREQTPSGVATVPSGGILDAGSGVGGQGPAGVGSAASSGAAAPAPRSAPSFK